MKIWQMEPYPIGDRRLPHHVFPPKLFTADQLQNMTGVITYKIDLDDVNAMKKRISRVKAERKVSTSDVFRINTCMIDMEHKLNELYESTTRKDDIIHLVIEGSAYYDVEVNEDDWIRMNVEKGDLIVLPRGLCHRFALTTQNNVTIQRFYQANDNDMPQEKRKNFQ